MLEETEGKAETARTLFGNSGRPRGRIINTPG